MHDAAGTAGVQAAAPPAMALYMWSLVLSLFSPDECSLALAAYVTRASPAGSNTAGACAPALSQLLSPLMFTCATRLALRAGVMSDLFF